jgi:uncharacterized membrane protein (UPF0127 family)
VRDSSRLLFAVALLLVGIAVAILVVGLPGDERTTVSFVDEDGTELTKANVAVSDSLSERYTGLSDTESLDPNEGMLFVHPVAGEHTYVMRDMAFPIDMVFVAENGTITTIHHAELPEDGADLKEYRGRGKYIVELPYEFTTDHGIEVGDTVRIAEEYQEPESTAAAQSSLAPVAMDRPVQRG